MQLVRTNLLHSLFLFCDERGMGSVCVPNKPLEGFGRREEGKGTDMSAHLSRSDWASMVPIKYIVLYEICSFSMVSGSRDRTVCVCGGDERQNLALDLGIYSLFNWMFIYDTKNELPFPSVMPLWQRLACHSIRRLRWPLGIYKFDKNLESKIKQKSYAFRTCKESGYYHRVEQH